MPKLVSAATSLEPSASLKQATMSDKWRQKMTSTPGVSKIWRQILRRLPPPVAPADGNGAIGGSTNASNKEELANTLGLGQNAPSTASGLEKSREDSQNLRENTEDTNQTDYSPDPKVSSDLTDNSKPPAEEKPPSQLETVKDPPVSLQVSDGLAPESGPPAEERPKSQFWTPEEKAAELWAAAYDRLREKSPELVHGYTIAIKNWLASYGINSEAQGWRQAAIDLPAEEWFVRPPLNLVVGVMLEEPGPETESHSKQEPEPKPIKPSEGHDSASSVVVKEAARSLSKLPREALRAAPHASMAWAATYITLQVCSTLVVLICFQCS
ncbi:hypothetical protein V8C35DRAFT_208334 [Trichoderma chlorosporum]